MSDCCFGVSPVNYPDSDPERIHTLQTGLCFQLKFSLSASGNNHSNMLSPQDKGPIFNVMKCHCGVYSSFCVFLKS